MLPWLLLYLMNGRQLRKQSPVYFDKEQQTVAAATINHDFTRLITAVNQGKFVSRQISQTDPLRISEIRNS